MRKLTGLVAIAILVLGVACSTPGNAVGSQRWKPSIQGMNLYDISPEQLGSERHFRYHFQLLLIKNMITRSKESNCNPEMLEYLARVQKSVEVQRDGDVELLTEIRREFKEDDRLFFFEDKRQSHEEYGYLILGKDRKERRRWVLVESGNDLDSKTEKN